MSYARAYYYDAQRQRGRCPADEALGIGDGFSPGVKRLAVKLAALGPYELAAALLDELAGVPISPSRIWAAVQAAGVAASQHLAAQAASASALPDPDEISPGLPKTATRLATTMDGAKLNIRGEGWKEAKIGCVFEFVPRPPGARSTQAQPSQTRTRERPVQARQIAYVFHLGPPEPFGQLVWVLAQLRQWEAAGTTAVIGDGAPWIWNLAQRYFADSTHIVDWYHAKQHLWAAARLIAPADDVRAAAWVRQYEDPLFAGHAHTVSAAITAAIPASTGTTPALLEREAGYFVDNAARMTYADFDQRQLPIGSGTVESAAKQFKDRFTAAGMRWSRQGAVNLMPFRAAVMSRQFDALWRQACP